MDDDHRVFGMGCIRKKIKNPMTTTIRADLRCYFMFDGKNETYELALMSLDD